MAEKKFATPEDWVDAIPDDMKGHVFHLLGKELGHRPDGGAQPDDDSGDTRGKP